MDVFRLAIAATIAAVTTDTRNSSETAKAQVKFQELKQQFEAYEEFAEASAFRALFGDPLSSDEQAHFNQMLWNLLGHPAQAMPEQPAPPSLPLAPTPVSAAEQLAATPPSALNAPTRPLTPEHTDPNLDPPSLITPQSQPNPVLETPGQETVPQGSIPVVPPPPLESLHETAGGAFVPDDGAQGGPQPEIHESPDAGFPPNDQGSSSVPDGVTGQSGEVLTETPTTVSGPINPPSVASDIPQRIPDDSDATPSDVIGLTESFDSAEARPKDLETITAAEVGDVSSVLGSPEQPPQPPAPAPAPEAPEAAPAPVPATEATTEPAKE